ncbi:MAG TPA: AI-2E family transporter [Bauldia sp.]|nr:AI-2E family transporter [Bauldia sp.]
MTAEQARFATFVLAAILAFLAVWLLIVGKSLILPIFTAIISVYVLSAAADAMGRLPLLGRLPSFVRRLLVLIGFALCLVGFGLVISTTVDQLMVLAPTYKDNLASFGTQLADLVGLKSIPTWEQIRAEVFPELDLKDILLGLLGSVTSLGSGIFLVVVYAVFLLAEQGSFAGKLAAAFPEGDRAARMAQLFTDINRRIGDYLAVKTLVNVILGAVSYMIMLFMALDFALFWAILIALFNYIPFIGTFAIVFPIFLSLAQFGSLTTTLVLAALLLCAQLISDNVLEPKLFSRQLNMSPFVIIVALSFWSALWGLPGAILAIPITSMIAIICAAFPATRFIAMLLAERVEDARQSTA